MTENAEVTPPVEHGSAEKTKKKQWIIVAGVIILLIAAGIFSLYELGYIGGREEIPEDGILIGSGVQEISEGETTGDHGSNGKAMLSIDINGRPVFSDGRSEGNLNIVNPDSNVLYMKVEITLNDTGETIYESGGIPPNHFIGNDTLAVVLSKGEHEATAHVSFYDPDELSAEYNSLNFDLILTIEN